MELDDICSSPLVRGRFLEGSVVGLTFSPIGFLFFSRHYANNPTCCTNEYSFKEKYKNKKNILFGNRYGTGWHILKSSPLLRVRILEGCVEGLTCIVK